MRVVVAVSFSAPNRFPVATIDKVKALLFAVFFFFFFLSTDRIPFVSEVVRESATLASSLRWRCAQDYSSL